MKDRGYIAVVWAGLTALGLVLGCDRVPGKPTEAQRPLLASQVSNFDELYGHSCAGCHGGDGQLGAARPLRDPLYLALLRPDTLRQIIAQGVPGTTMPAFSERSGGGLTDKQIDILIDGMQTRWGRPQAFTSVTLPPYSLEEALAAGAEPGDLERGKTDLHHVLCPLPRPGWTWGRKGWGGGRWCLSDFGERSGSAYSRDCRPRGPGDARLAGGSHRPTDDHTGTDRCCGLAGVTTVSVFQVGPLALARAVSDAGWCSRRKEQTPWLCKNPNSPRPHPQTSRVVVFCSPLGWALNAVAATPFSYPYHRLCVFEFPLQDLTGMDFTRSTREVPRGPDTPGHVQKSVHVALGRLNGRYPLLGAASRV